MCHGHIAGGTASLQRRIDGWCRSAADQLSAHTAIEKCAAMQFSRAVLADTTESKARTPNWILFSYKLSWILLDLSESVYIGPTIWGLYLQ